MYRLIAFLKPVIRFNYSHPYVLLAAAFLLSIISATFALRLTVDTDIANLLPPTNKYVVALDELKERVGGETEMEVVIKSDSFDDNMRFARELINRTMQLEYHRRGNLYFSRYEFRKDTEVLERYALYLATESEINELLEYLDDEIEQAKLDANPFFIDFEDDFEDDVEEDVRKHSFEDAYGDLIPSEYPISADSTVMLIKFYPTGSRSD
ncbi:MAG: transporter, partial [Rhodothermaceae bacterium]|nr:transporter [Rhodothermaceae bacterium]